ncbi:MAG: ABC transporter permease [Actinomycetota bacterium]|nr:ABC transporter permease [Actinomycetota bacterium]
MRTAWTIAKHTLRECTRRRVFLVVPVAALGFLALFALGAHLAFRTTGGTFEEAGRLVDARALVGASLVGLSMFVTLFLGSSLGIFLTFSAVRGDAEQGTLQPLIVRPVARSGLLLGRFLGATLVCAVYVVVLYAGAVVLVGVSGNWWPDPLVAPVLHLVLAVTIVIALSLLGSVFLPALPNGIVMFMAYGAGLLAGLLGQLGEGIGSSGLERTGRISAWVLPYEALYQAGLHSLTSQATGLTRVVVQLGPLGGAEAGGAPLIAWSLLYLALVGGATLLAFERKDL